MGRLVEEFRKAGGRKEDEETRDLDVGKKHEEKVS